MRLRKADGHALRWLREENWLSQKELSALANVSRQTIIEIETGRNTSPRNETLFALAEALGVDPEALLEQHSAYIRPAPSEATEDLSRPENDDNTLGTFGVG